ncbi:Rap1a/Tai family immunity protein [Sulfitobacter sp. M23508]|uniref:Rap1a/Tai family immunity protein n=2 Tax=unclassified Sulfitobacter TaxID=196795 RepID=UPI0037452C94
MKKLALMLALAGGPAAAQMITANELYDICAQTTDVEVAECYAYATGAHEAFSDAGRLGGLDKYCPPPDAPNAEIPRLFGQYLRANQNTADWGASTVIYLALLDAYPCR